jgi:N-succinyldiaminopimelate aminotransferase
MVHPVFDKLPTTIFERMSGLARQHGAINLGQGFPDDQGPLPVREAAARALIEGSNQYPPMRGLPELRAAVAGHYARTQASTLIRTRRSSSPPARPRPWRRPSSR